MISHRIHRHQKLVSLSSLLVVALAGCAKTQPPTPTYAVDESQIELANTALAVSDSLNQMASVTAAKTNRVIQNDEPNAHDYGMGRLVSVNWSGPIEPLVEQLASSSDFRLQVFGRAPAVPVLVSLNKQHTSAGALLQDTILQSRDRAQIYVFPDEKIIELHYIS